jgi:hypothetical protein
MNVRIKIMNAKILVRMGMARVATSAAFLLVSVLHGGELRAAESSVTELFTRTRVGAGEEVGVSSFIINGSGSKNTLVRVLGPSLVNSGLGAASVLQDPILQIFDGSGTVVGMNDNWRESQEAAIQATGRAPSNDLESAIIASLPAGNYTATYVGKNGGTGVGQIEIIDLDTPQPAATYFANFTSNGFLGTGEQTMLLGYTVTGPDPTRLLTRLLGPSLFGTGSGFSTDPAIDLRAANNSLVATNDDWQQSPQRAEIEASGFAPADPREAALIVDSTAGRYTAVARGTQGKVRFEAFSFTVPGSTPTALQLLNISTRMQVGTDPNQLIGGFIITGSEPKKVIVLATGPSLAAFGLQGVLEDPVLELFQGNTLIANNDNWKVPAQAEIEATGLKPGHDLESALVRTLAPGAYTAIVRGTGNGTGVGTVQIYDLATSSNSKLANISSRGFVQAPDDKVMIAGFIIGGSGGAPCRVVVRALGPSLSAFGIAGALADPALELKNSNGATLVSNDDWQQAQGAAEISSRNLAPGDVHESALVTSLPNGSYTAIVRGKGGATGVAVVEVYNVD